MSLVRAEPPAPIAPAYAERLVAARARVAALAEVLGRDELGVLEMVAEGLARGRGIYGELRAASDRRDFTREAGAEIRDALVYLAAELVRLDRIRGRR